MLGGGYAGVLAANHLRQRDDVDITLVNARPSFVERIRLHQLITGSHDAVVDYRRLLGEGIRLVIDGAIRIDATTRTVALASGSSLDYDYLIYAVGSTGSAPKAAGAAEFSYPIADLEHAEVLREAVAAAAPDAPIVVVGGGPTGIETASELAEIGRAVTLVCGPILGPSVGEGARRSIAKRLAKLGVRVLVGPTASVTTVTHESVALADGRTLPSAITMWTTGFGVPELAARSGLSTDGLGRLLTDETLTSIDDDRIVAAGDAASPSNQPLRMSCQAALPLGAQAANTVLSRIAGTEPAPLNQAFTGQCISVGRGAGTIQICHKDDTPRGLYLGGRTGALVKEAVCKGTISLLTREARKPGAYWWMKGSDRPAQRQSARS